MCSSTQPAAPARLRQEPSPQLPSYRINLDLLSPSPLSPSLPSIGPEASD